MQWTSLGQGGCVIGKPSCSRCIPLACCLPHVCSQPQPCTQSVLPVNKALPAREAPPPLRPCRKEVERFREATGKDVGALEAEKTARGALESRTRAQVRNCRQGDSAGERGVSVRALCKHGPVRCAPTLRGAVLSSLLPPCCRCAHINKGTVARLATAGGAEQQPA